MFSLFGVKTWGLLILCLLYTGSAMAEPTGLLLKISQSRTGQILQIHPVRCGDTVRLSWIHSVELTPWEEDYTILSDGTLLLKTARFKSYGAGVPEYGGEHRLVQGWIVRDGINRELPALNWIHSHTANFQIHLNDVLLVRPKDLPHHEPLKLFIEKEAQ